MTKLPSGEPDQPAGSTWVPPCLSALSVGQMLSIPDTAVGCQSRLGPRPKSATVAPVRPVDTLQSIPASHNRGGSVPTGRRMNAASPSTQHQPALTQGDSGIIQSIDKRAETRLIGRPPARQDSHGLPASLDFNSTLVLETIKATVSA